VTRFAQGPASSPGFLLWRLTLAWQRAVTTALAPLGLTHVQFVLLASAWWLAEQGTVPHQQDLATHAGTDARMTSEVVRKLADKGLLAREVDARDTRARQLRPTAAGVALAKRAIQAVEDVDAAFFATESDTLVPLLTRLVNR